MSWLLPTIVPFKTAKDGFVFLALAIVFGSVAFWLIVGDVRKRFAWNKILSEKTVRVVRAAWVVLILVGGAGMLLREYSDIVAVAEGRRPDPYKERRTFERRLYDDVEQFAKKWGAERGRKGVWIGFFGNYDTLTQTNYWIRASLEGRKSEFDIRCWNVIPDFASVRRPELVLVPCKGTAAPMLTAVAPSLAEVDDEEARAYLLKQGYSPAAELDMSGYVRFEVFQYPEPTPLPKGYGWP
jgi:hypothetical protein